MATITSLQQSISQVESSLTVKGYRIDLESNAYVSPFSAYQGVDISADISAFGTAIHAICTNGASTNPVLASVSSTSLRVYASKVATVYVTVTFKK